MDDERPTTNPDGEPLDDNATSAYDFETELRAQGSMFEPEAGGDAEDDAEVAGAASPGTPESDRPSIRFPLDDPSSVQGVIAQSSETVDASSLPHWSERPQVPAPTAAADDEDLDAWSGLRPSPPAWQSERDEWHPDDDVSRLADDSVRIGALADDGAGDRGGRGAAASAKRLASGAGRNLSQAVIVGLGLFFALLILAAIGPGALMFIVTPILVVASLELYRALQSVGYQPATLVGATAVGGMALGAFWRGEAAIPLVFFLATVAVFVWHLIGVETENVTANSAVTLFGVAWIGMMGSFAALILGVPGRGVSILVSLVIITVASDVGAYALGRRFGRTPIAPSVSPNKTIEGTIGGAVVAIAVSLVVVYAVPGLTPYENSMGDAFWLGLIIAIAAPLGDMCESLIKRDLGVKDMGDILPGHGGVLDRFDAMLFVLPSVYYLSRLLDLI